MVPGEREIFARGKKIYGREKRKRFPEREREVFILKRDILLKFRYLLNLDILSKLGYFVGIHLDRYEI